MPCGDIPPQTDACPAPVQEGAGPLELVYSAACDLARTQSQVQRHVTGPAEVQEGAWPLVSGIQRIVWPCAKAGGVP